MAGMVRSTNVYFSVLRSSFTLRVYTQPESSIMIYFTTVLKVIVIMFCYQSSRYHHANDKPTQTIPLTPIL